GSVRHGLAEAAKLSGAAQSGEKRSPRPSRRGLFVGRAVPPMPFSRPSGSELVVGQRGRWVKAKPKGSKWRASRVIGHYAPEPELSVGGSAIRVLIAVTNPGEDAVIRARGSGHLVPSQEY